MKTYENLLALFADLENNRAWVYYLAIKQGKWELVERECVVDIGEHSRMVKTDFGFKKSIVVKCGKAYEISDVKNKLYDRCFYVSAVEGEPTDRYPEKVWFRKQNKEEARRTLVDILKQKIAVKQEQLEKDLSALNEFLATDI